MKINKVWAMPSAWTFTIKPIGELVSRYVGDGKGWADPFAGKSQLAEFRNDINPAMKQPFCMDSKNFAEQLEQTNLEGILFDPPYSYRQVSEHYKEVGKKATSLDTSSNFYNRVMNVLADKIKIGGYAISFGWNSNGFGKNRGYEQIEILLVAHGGHHNDTIVVVEQRVQGKLI